MDRVEQRQEEVGDRVTGFVVRRQFLLPLVHLAGLLLGADHDLDGGFLDVIAGDGFPSGTGGEEGRFVHEVLEIRTGEAGSGTGDDVEVDVRAEGLVPGVDLEDGFPSLHVGIGDSDLAVEPSRTQQGRV